MIDNTNTPMDWNDTIQEDGHDLILLPEGDYNFTVTNFERGRYPGGNKMPACPKAMLTVEVTTNDGVAIIRFDLFLCKVVEWRISSFFRCLGFKKKGEQLKMEWDKVVGSKGRAHFKQKVYTNQQGEEKTINELDRFYDYDPNNFKVEEVAIDDLPF